MSLRERILSSDDVASEIVDVPEWGVKIEVRGLSALARAELFAKHTDPDGEIETEGFFGTLLVHTCHDPESGEPIFTLEDVAAVVRKNWRPVERVGAVASRLSGLGVGAAVLDVEEAVERAGKDSSSTPRNASPSS